MTEEYRVFTHRVERIEKQNRRLKRLLLLFFALVVGALLVGQATSRSWTVRAEKFVVTDRNGKICAEMILPYPPGIPLVLPGEMITDESIAVLEFLLSLCEIGEHFTGFSTDIHGTYQEDDKEYYVKVIKH